MTRDRADELAEEAVGLIQQPRDDADWVAHGCPSDATLIAAVIRKAMEERDDAMHAAIDAQIKALRATPHPRTPFQQRTIEDSIIALVDLRQTVIARAIANLERNAKTGSAAEPIKEPPG